MPESRLKDFGSDAERAFKKEYLPEGQAKYSCLVADCNYSYVPTTKVPKAVVKNLRLHVKRHMYVTPSVSTVARLFRISCEQRKRQAASNTAPQTPTTRRVKDEPSAGPATAEPARPSIRASGTTPDMRSEASSRSTTSSSPDEG